LNFYLILVKNKLHCIIFLILITLFSCSNNSSKEITKNCIHSIIFHDVQYDSDNTLNTSPDYFSDITDMIYYSGKQTLFASEAVDRIVEKNIPNNHYITITFDDAWTGIVDYAQPILQKNTMKATFFVHVEGIDQGRPTRCDWSDLHSLVESNLWEIHSHSLTHHNLTKISTNDLVTELKESLEKLHQSGFTNANIIAYPFGYYNEHVQHVAKEVGYKAGFTAGPNPCISDDGDLFSIPRTTICQLYNQKTICAKLGISLKETRNSIAIYDDQEGELKGTWDCINYETATNGLLSLGQIGKTYCVSNTKDDTWSIQFEIHKNNSLLSLYLWKPTKYKNETIGKLSIRWRLHKINDTDPVVIVNENIIRDSNRWNFLKQVQLDKGTYTFEVSPARNEAIFIDALKIQSDSTIQQ
jgi:peptidoglycan/xylan/chitin deacetylase (PgdA/CDA1 family)